MSEVTVSSLSEKHQVYVGNLPHELDEDALASFISEKTGSTFQSIRLMKDKNTGKSRGSAYIDYIEKAAADAAISALSGTQIQDRIVKVNAAEPRTDKVGKAKFEKTPQENSCFIGNLDFAVTQEDILTLCNNLLGEGVATRVRLASDRETGIISILFFTCNSLALAHWFTHHRSIERVWSRGLFNAGGGSASHKCPCGCATDGKGAAY